jgi:hypothetical protein
MARERDQVADKDTSRGYVPTEAERGMYQADYRLFTQLQIYRNVFAAQWEEAARLILPTSLNTFMYGSYNFPGQKKTEQQVDASGMLALTQFVAIADSLVTPKNQFWHGFKVSPDLMRDRAVRVFLGQLRDIVFDFRYRTIGNFEAQKTNNYQSLGAFGNSIMFVDAFDNRWNRGSYGLRYKAVPLGECFFGENHQGVVNTIVRWFRRTADQAREAFGEERLPGALCTALDQNSQTPFDFLHVVRPRDADDYDPQRLDYKGMPFTSRYYCIQGETLMAPESGFRKFPYAVSRYDQTPGEVYGRGPAQMVLPSLKTLNAQKRTFLKTGHRAADPVYLIGDDGLMSLDQRPGAINPGGVSSDGKELVKTLPVGNVQFTLEMMQEERSIIDNMFFTPLFKTLTDHPDMTATQVIELLNERGMLVAPTLGRQHSENIGNMVPREVDILQQMRLLPQMPPALREAGGLDLLQVEDTSPLAMAAKGNQLAGFNRWVSQLHEWASVTGDMSILDPVNFTTAVPDSGRIQSVREDWISTPQQIAGKEKNRAAAAQRQATNEAAPGQAALMNAQAKIQKLNPGMQQGAQPQPQPTLQ